MIPTDFAQEEKLWKKLMSENDSSNIFDGYFPTIAELSRWLQACEGNYSSTEFLHFFAELAKCRTAGNFSTQGFYFGRLGSIENLLEYTTLYV